MQNFMAGGIILYRYNFGYIHITFKSYNIAKASITNGHTNSDRFKISC